MSTEDVTFENIKDPLGEIYQYHSTAGSTHNSSVPISVKKKLINLVFLKDRCKEELLMINEEMTRFVHFISNEITLISNTITDPVAQFDNGLKSLLLQKALKYQSELTHLEHLWGNLIQFPLSKFNTVTYSSFNSLVTVDEITETLFDVNSAEELCNESDEVPTYWGDDAYIDV